MRIPHRNQLLLDVTPISKIELNLECRDRMIPTLVALQFLYTNPEFRDKALQLVEQDLAQHADLHKGKPGMTLWQILVLASVKQACNYTYDHLQYLAENDRNLEAMLQRRNWQEEELFRWKRIQANVCLVRPETIEQISNLVVTEGHRLVPEAAEQVRGDCFVAETNIHYPTESSLLIDGLTKIVGIGPELAALTGQSRWRQSKSLLEKAKRAARAIGRIKKGAKYQERLQKAYGKLFHFTDLLLPRTVDLLDSALGNLSEGSGDSSSDDILAGGKAITLYRELVYWHAATSHVRGTAWRRVMEGEKVSNPEKLFSLFEPDTELIKRGKASQPVQFGHRVLVVEDAAGFICHHKIVPLHVEERDIVVAEMASLQQRLQNRIERASFDRGFHSPENQEGLAKIVKHPCIPKTGSHQSAEQRSTATVEFRESQRRHSGVESAIGALQSGNGLKRCRDHSRLGYERYVALGVLGRNLLVLGKLLISQRSPTSAAAYSTRAA